MVNVGVSQGFVLGPLLFLIFINHLYLTRKYSKVHYFTNNTNFKNSCPEVLCKNGVLKNSQNSQENTCVRVSSLRHANLLKMRL